MKAKMGRPGWALLLWATLGSLSVAGNGPGDTVTLPRWRYEELLRKEAELEKLRRPVSVAASNEPNSLSAVLPSAGPGPAAPTSHLTRAEAAIEVPNLTRDDRVSAVDLALYFRRDPLLASQRHRNLPLRVHGRIAGFEKPLWTRDYHVLLETDQPGTRIRCVVELPETFRGAYLAEAGATLMVADATGARRPLMQIGESVELTGTLRGLKGSTIELAGCRVLSHR